MYATFPVKDEEGDGHHRLCFVIALVATSLFGGAMLTTAVSSPSNGSLERLRATSDWVVYVSDGSRLLRLSCTGTRCTGEVVAEGLAEARDLAIDDRRAFWAEERRIQRIDLASRRVDTLLNVTATALALDADVLFFVDAQRRSVSRVDLTAPETAPSIVFDVRGTLPTSLAVDGDVLWWIGDGRLSAGPIDGSTDVRAFESRLDASCSTASRLSSRHQLYLLCSKNGKMQVLAIDPARASAPFDKTDFLSIVPEAPALAAPLARNPRVALSATEDALWFTSGGHAALMVQPLAPSGLAYGGPTSPALPRRLIPAAPATLVAL
mmetsp:Transcript_2755/g.8679  ORF Transcript_2755/g.8679 Transcript_2755/m.8679 type:complete len:323 (-) Transcript_2755:105-1073(-)